MTMAMSHAKKSNAIMVIDLWLGTGEYGTGDIGGEIKYSLVMGNVRNRK